MGKSGEVRGEDILPAKKAFFGVSVGEEVRNLHDSVSETSFSRRGMLTCLHKREIVSDLMEELEVRGQKPMLLVNHACFCPRHTRHLCCCHGV